MSVCGVRMDVKRREFLNLLAGTAGAAALGNLVGCGGGGNVTNPNTNVVTVPPVSQGIGDPGIPQLPIPSQSGIDHIIVIMLESRSFDHLLGWLPGGQGVQARVTYADRTGAPDDVFRSHLGTLWCRSLWPRTSCRCPTNRHVLVIDAPLRCADTHATSPPV